MDKITFRRPLEKFNKNCSYQIIADGKRLAELKNGEEKTVELPENVEHLCVRAKIQWCGSGCLKLDTSSSTEILKVTGNEFLNRKMPLFGAIFPLTGMILFTGTNQFFRHSVIGILVFLMIGIIMTLTVWKDRWLKIEKIK